LESLEVPPFPDLDVVVAGRDVVAALLPDRDVVEPVVLLSAH